MDTKSNKNVTKGIYKHYKGKLYEVLNFGRHSDTLEEYVIYRAKYFSEEFGDSAVWVKPKKDFLMDVEVNGKKIPSFTKIEIKLY